MNSSFTHRLILILLIGCGTKTCFANVTNTPPGGIWGMVKLATTAPKVEAIAEQPSLTSSNSAAGLDLGVGASSVVQPEIRLLADGAVADYGLQKVFFPAEITEAPLTIITPDGRKLACRATFLAVHDAVSGKSVLLGQVTNSIGVLIGDNTVLYQKAFGSLASLRYRYTQNSLEQDVILDRAFKVPAEWQPDQVSLEVWSEWIDSTPDTKESQVIDLRPLAATGTQPAVAASDEHLKFGAMRIGEGFAFGIQNEGGKTPVAKTFGRVEGRDWLIERVDYTALKPLLDKLPKSQASLSPDNLKPGRSELIRSLHARTNPKPSGTPMRLAKAAPADQNSIVLDFVIVSSVPVPAGVISWWPAGGNANDAIIASGNHGTWVGTAAYGVGKVGQGLSLGGVNNAVTVPNTASLNFGVAQDFTLETWIKPLTNSNPGAIMSITGKRTPSGIGYELFLVAGQLGFQMGDPVHGLLNVGVAGDLRADGQYHHIAITVARNNPNGGKLYVDGVANFFDPTPISGDLSNTQPFRIGVHPDSYYGYFKGIIDEPAIYGRALGASEIQGIYNAGVAGKNNPNCVVAPTNIVAWWPGDGNLYDLARTNQATLSGATYESAVASQGFSFNGTNAGVTAADDNALNLATTNDHITIEAWIKPLANINDYGVMSVIGKRSSPNSSTATGYELFLVNGVPGFQIANGTSYANFVATGDLRDGGFHHLVVSMDRSSTSGGHIYVDGVAKLTFNPTVLSASLSNSAPVRIGAPPQSGFNGWYKGVIDEVTLYRRALSGTEISQLYEAGGAGKCKDDLDHDGLPDWWEIKYFGNLDQVGTADQGANWDYDGDGVSNLQEYLNGTDPNKIVFDVQFANDHTASNTATGSVEVTRGVPAQMAILIDSTNFAVASWSSYNSNLTANLGSTDGRHDVWVGLRGLAQDSQQTWDWSRITRDATPPSIVITNPISGTNSRPMIQLQGYSREPLTSIRFDLTNAAGLVTNLQGFVTDQSYDTNFFEFTTNWFQCFDIALTNGVNTITLRATDLAGNVSTNTYNYTLSFAGDTNAPLIKLYWPRNGAHISGTNFILRGFLDDPTATVVAQIVSTNGVTNIVAGLVERNGLFWAKELPLTSGTNTLTLTATDAAGNVATTNINVIKSAVILTINDVDDAVLNQPRITVSGTINVANYTVWVNGVKAATNSGSWSVDNVPLNAGGTAVIQARAIPNSDNGGNGTGGSGSAAATDENPGNPTSCCAEDAEVQDKEKPDFLYAKTYEAKWTQDLAASTLIPRDKCKHYAETMDWAYNKVSSLKTVCDLTTWQSYTNGVPSPNHYECSTTWPADANWPPVISGTQICSDDYYGTTSTITVDAPIIPSEHCEVADRRYSFGFFWWKTDTYARHADTTWTLKVGGKEIQGKPRLGVINGGAIEILDKRARPPFGQGTPQRAITSEQVTIADLGKLNSDGMLAFPAPAGAKKDITPKTTRKYYGVWVGANGYAVVSTCQSPIPKDKTRLTVGVGEYVDFGFNPPAAPELLAAIWSTTAGSVSTITNYHTTFTAPSNANASVTITMRYINAKIPTTYNVVEPTGVHHAETIARQPYTPGFAGAGMHLRVIMGPTNVSFYRIQVMEVGNDASSVTGYFTNSSTLALTHKPPHGADVWITPIGYNNAWPDNYDWAKSDEYSAYSPGGWLGGGGFTWQIPGKWKIGNGPTNNLANPWDQVFTLLPDGTMTVTKFSHTVTRATNQQYGTVVPDP